MVVLVPYSGEAAAWLAYLIAIFGVAFLVQIGLLTLIRPHVQRMFRHEVRSIGIRVCVACGYDLRAAAATANCPECGTLDQHTKSLSDPT
ncbi:MAG: hypothetical protein ACKVS9_15525 [Phycisphaerae bacterium]